MYDALSRSLPQGLSVTEYAPADDRSALVLTEQQAQEQAANPVLMGLARSAARDAIRQNLAIPLEVAGFGAVTVTVRFDGEPLPAR